MKEQTMTPDQIKEYRRQADVLEWMLNQREATTMRQLCDEVERLQHQIAQASERLADVVIVDGASAGIFKMHTIMQRYVTDDGEVRSRISPAGKALFEIWKGLGE